MAVNIGAAIAGFSKTVQEKAKEDEKRVHLLTDKAIDFHTQELWKQKDKRDSDITESDKILNSLLPYFGDDQYARQKAASIAKGGAAYAERMMDYFDQGKSKGITANDIYKYIPDPKVNQDASLFTAENIVKGLDIPTIDRTKAGKAGLFTSDPSVLFDEEMQRLARTGQIPEITKPTELKFGTSTVDLSGLREAPDLNSQYSDIVFKQSQIKDKSSEEYQQLEAQRKEVTNKIQAFELETTIQQKSVLDLFSDALQKQKSLNENDAGYKQAMEDVEYYRTAYQSLEKEKDLNIGPALAKLSTEKANATDEKEIERIDKEINVLLNVQKRLAEAIDTTDPKQQFTAGQYVSIFRNNRETAASKITIGEDSVMPRVKVGDTYLDKETPEAQAALREAEGARDKKTLENVLPKTIESFDELLMSNPGLAASIEVEGLIDLFEEILSDRATPAIGTGNEDGNENDNDKVPAIGTGNENDNDKVPAIKLEFPEFNEDGNLNLDSAKAMASSIVADGTDSVDDVINNLLDSDYSNSYVSAVVEEIRNLDNSNQPDNLKLKNVYDFITTESFGTASGFKTRVINEIMERFKVNKDEASRLYSEAIDKFKPVETNIPKPNNATGSGQMGRNK